MESVGVTTALQEKEALSAIGRKTPYQRKLYENFGKYTLRVGSVAAFLVLWHVLSAINFMWPLQFGNLPSPLEVLQKWKEVAVSGHYYVDMLYSLYRVTLGIVLGLIFGVLLGVWIGLSSKANDSLFPTLEIFRPIPLIAFLPVTMLLFSTIEGGIVFITFIGAFFPILISTRNAVKRVSPVLINASRCLGCPPSKAVWKVYLPAAAPGIFSALTVGVGASWMAVITAEMMAGQYGVGYYTWEAYHLMQYEESIVGMFTIGLLGYVFSAVIRVIEKLFVKWKTV
ncbi:ABC transporter permease [Paenibacillus alkalitolerans]|uniref:ABC transporter permease n=1 Tax=Paenibacillus alkalitolerans TaxID=2799335 RepID=UPI0018F2F059|nr:ABC transporter permease [Paenibacillus alkalitolerans]